MAAKNVLKDFQFYNGKKVLSGGTINIKPQLGTVSGVKVKASESKVSLSWNSVRGAEKYNVYRSNGRNMVLLGTTEKLKFADKGLSIGVTYTYYVQPVNETMGCTGSYSKEVYCKIPLEKVTKVTAVNSESAAVTLKWSKVSNADGYMIYCAEKEDGFYQKIAEVKGNNNRTYTHKKLEKNTSYFYKVVAFKVNEGGVKSKSEDSKIVQVEIEK